MKTMGEYDILANKDSIENTFEALEMNGIHPYLVKNKEEATEKILNLIPNHQEIMNMTSVSLAEMGIDKMINTSTDYISIRRLMNNEKITKIEKKRLGTAQEWAIGSVHAITEKGQILIASATGSQLPSYSYGANNLILVVGTQKIVKDINEGFERINEYVFPLENARAMEVYGVGSGINKILIINKEVIAGRIHIIFVEEKLGF
ncbi:MAG: LUD domain-containing protein [Candidatus Gracilibacteria bacterium]|nr:LUD domain-containing protein [Candidatus Gracilibacteria bacterium]MDD2908166.1 LUD domain-containing protein [Candidatus Gracilibacteria bacterium]